MDIKEESQYIRPEMEIISIYLNGVIMEASPNDNENPEGGNEGGW